MPQVNLKDKTALVYDLGSYCDLAVRFGRDFKKVYYYTPWQEAFPHRNKSLIGYGMEGIERIQDFWNYVDKADLIYFPDTYNGDLVEYLKRKKYPVAGTGNAERYELKRWEARKTQKEVGLPVQKTIRVKGLKELRKELKEVKNKYVKLNTFRGDLESFHHIDYETSLSVLDEMAYRIGAGSETIEFLVEEFIEGIEPGFDGIVYDGKYMSPTMYGYEQKDEAYIGKVLPYNEIPEPLKEVNKGFASVFKDTRFWLSTELRIADNKPYLIDLTMRNAAPFMWACQAEMYDNFSEVCWGLGHNNPIVPKTKYKYCLAVAITSQWSDEHWVRVKFPKDLRKWIKFTSSAMFDGNYYCVPKTPVLASLVSVGNDIDDLIKDIKEKAERIQGTFVKVHTDKLEELKQKTIEGTKYGVNF